MMKYKNRDVIVLRPLAGGNSWTDDQVVVRVLESGDEEVVRKGDIVGYTEDPESDAVKKGEALVGVARDPNHPASNADKAKKDLEAYDKSMKEKHEEQLKRDEDRAKIEAKQAPVVQTVPFDAKTSNPTQPATAMPAISRTVKK